MNKGEKRAKAEFDILAKIRKEKERRGWTDYQLAENAGITQSTLSTWNKRNIEPGIASVEKICHALGMSLSQFFSDESVENEQSEDQRKLWDSWEKLTPSQRIAVQSLLDSFLDS